MCGIIAAFNKDVKKKDKTIQFAEPVNDFIINQYEDQHSRGKEGFGIIRIREDGTINIDRATEPVKFMFDLYRTPSDSMVVHHRNPSSTDNKISQTHPIIVQHKDLLKHTYAIIHNGICSNASDLKIEFEKLGFKYHTETKDAPKWSGYHTKDTFNDTESFAIATALYIENLDAVCRAKGNHAFIAVQMDKVSGKVLNVFFGRSGGVLKMAQTRGKLRISSEGEGNEIPDNTMYSFKYADDSMELTKRKFDVEAYSTTPASRAHSFSSTEESDAKQGSLKITQKSTTTEDEKAIIDEFKKHDAADDLKAAHAIVATYKETLRSCASHDDVMMAYEEFKDDIEDDIYTHFSGFMDSMDPGAVKVYGSRISPDDALAAMRHLFVALELGSRATLVEAALWNDKLSTDNMDYNDREVVHIVT